MVIPAYNEQARIRPTLVELDSFLAGRAFTSEIVVIDDGSLDGTSDIVRELGELPGGRIRLERNSTNHGKGYAVRQGVMAARGEIILYCDADLSVPEIEPVIGPIREGTYDLVIGSRRSSQRATQPPLRRFLGAQFKRVRKRIVGLEFGTRSAASRPSSARRPTPSFPTSASMASRSTSRSCSSHGARGGERSSGRSPGRTARARDFPRSGARCPCSAICSGCGSI